MTTVLPDELSARAPYIAAIALALLLTALYKYSTYTNIPRIKQLPEIPGALPFAGHLHLLGGALGACDATVWSNWFQRFNWPIFQLRYGNERVVIVNKHADIKELWVSNSAALISRPVPYTMNKYVGLAMGACPWTEGCKRQRQSAIKSVAPGTWQTYYPLLKKTSASAIEDMRKHGQNGAVALEPRKYLARVAISLGFELAYGKKLEDVGGVDFLHGFLDAAGKITDIRVGSSNWVDYIPFPRLLPSSTVKRAQMGAAERQPYLDALFHSMKADLEQGRDVNCIGAALLVDRGSKMTEEDTKSTCVSMLQGSSETISGTLTCGLGSLCADADGLRLQDEAYEKIMERWGTPEEAFEHAFECEDIPLIVAIYKEMLRYYCVIPYCLPRLATKDVKLKSGATIPAGTTLYMNAEYGNHDPEFYGSDAYTFNPLRFLDKSSPVSSSPLPHFSYGAGARICPAAQISNRILYGLVIRLIVSFRIQTAPEAPPLTDPIKFNQNYVSLVAKPKVYLAYCIPRDATAS
ncbi:uncharacterized protein Z518_07177 [Rhinocladiella mackenziei CBS 650.93]|uniref:Cytochrome P450 n=1 Tax=Rhinocladiella mackenziei CBS 650.93 TaxID=1442369 RepID=A0A0D2ICP1_9EURO|nr:uncharacterized protein Z518_07177 [Rhinocladiella mackenziei CBS 650.93]KIX03624.1 hypothetical protein Z518_07177 [Rhinocladiella mackenziei CBS 650.93]